MDWLLFDTHSLQEPTGRLAYIESGGNHVHGKDVEGVHVQTTARAAFLKSKQHTTHSKLQRRLCLCFQSHSGLNELSAGICATAAFLSNPHAVLLWIRSTSLGGQTSTSGKNIMLQAALR